MHFTVYPVRINLRTLELLRMPSFAGNRIRGALGTLLRETTCTADCMNGADCDAQSECAYRRIFQPDRSLHGPSGLQDSPRPFAIRSHHLDRAVLAPETAFHFDLNFFFDPATVADPLTTALSGLSRDGFGPDRVAVSLESVQVMAPVTIPLAPTLAQDKEVTVGFVTPLELKHNGRVLDIPNFGALFNRIQQRLSNLRELYGEGSLTCDFQAQANRAEAIRLRCFSSSYKELERRSSRTGIRHPIGGIVGRATYEGAIGEFLPYLKAAVWTGVGRHASWGKGVLAVEPDGWHEPQRRKPVG